MHFLFAERKNSVYTDLMQETSPTPAVAQQPPVAPLVTPPPTPPAAPSQKGHSILQSEITIGAIAVVILIGVSFLDYIIGVIVASGFLGLMKNTSKKSRMIFYAVVFVLSFFFEYQRSVGHENAANLIGKVFFSAGFDIFLGMVIEFIVTKITKKKPATPVTTPPQTPTAA